MVGPVDGFPHREPWDERARRYGTICGEFAAWLESLVDRPLIGRTQSHPRIHGGAEFHRKEDPPPRSMRETCDDLRRMVHSWRNTVLYLSVDAGAAHVAHSLRNCVDLRRRLSKAMQQNSRLRIAMRQDTPFTFARRTFSAAHIAAFELVSEALNELNDRIAGSASKDVRDYLAGITHDATGHAELYHKHRADIIALEIKLRDEWVSPLSEVDAASLLGLMEHERPILLERDAEVNWSAVLAAFGSYPLEQSGSGGLPIQPIADDDSVVSLELALLSEANPIRQLWRTIKPLSRKCDFTSGSLRTAGDDQQAVDGRKLVRLCDQLREMLLERRDKGCDKISSTLKVPAQQATKSASPRRRGRKPKAPSNHEYEIVTAWETGRYSSKKDLADAKGYNLKTVRRAIDRHQKRKRRAASNRGQIPPSQDP